MFTEDLSQFFDTEDGFAVEATIKKPDSSTLRTINGIFENPLIEIELAGADVEGEASTFVCLTSDLASVDHDHTFVIEGVSYRLVKRHDDGTGISNLWIRK